MEKNIEALEKIVFDKGSLGVRMLRVTVVAVTGVLAQDAAKKGFNLALKAYKAKKAIS